MKQVEYNAHTIRLSFLLLYEMRKEGQLCQASGSNDAEVGVSIVLTAEASTVCRVLWVR